MSRKTFVQCVAVLLLLPILAIVFTSPPEAAAGPELLPNPSVETSSPANTAVPTGWNQGRWGTNTTVFSYPATGGHTGSRFTRFVMSNYVSGDAK